MQLLSSLLAARVCASPAVHAKAPTSATDEAPSATDEAPSAAAPPIDPSENLQTRVAERLQTHGLPAYTVTLTLRWHDRATLDYRIEATTPTKTFVHVCSTCSLDAVETLALTLVDQAIADLEQRRREAERLASQAAAQPPPEPPSPPPPSPSDRRWPRRRGLAAGLLAAGGATMLANIPVLVIGGRRELVEETWSGRTYDVYDWRPTGYAVLGIGAAALVGGIAWLAVEHARKPPRAHARRMLMSRGHGFSIRF